MSVRVGQVWRDRDQRPANRRLRVVEVRHDFAIVQNIKTRKRTRIHLSRFPKSYEFMGDA